MASDIEARGLRMAQLWIKLAVLYLLAGVIFGLVMAANHHFEFIPVHAHINLLGWATMALAGVIYYLFPHAGGSRLGLWHFWLHNLALPVSMVALFLALAGHPQLEKLAAASASVIVLGVALFAVNLFVNMRPRG
jgi:cbb3-type cytochrome oxidase subunit 1